jgi:arginyl-tRNA--protein-N-Asp/Glu arginylyltransferase
MTSHQRDGLQFYLTAPNPCPYLPDKTERKVFAHLIGMRADEYNNALSQNGFRRSQTIAYRPACDLCQACVSVRVPVSDFKPNRSMRRLISRNQDLIGYWKDNVPTPEQYELFRYYLESRHADGGMADMSVLDYAMMIEDSYVDTHLVEYRLRGPDSFMTGEGEGPLLGMTLIDVLEDGLSLVYAFYDVDQTVRGLGTFMILDQIARARRMGLPYIYLGYWVDGSPKMDYKSRFMPQERLTMQGWQRVEKSG